MKRLLRFTSIYFSMDTNCIKVIVIGLGNPICGDDGLGWHVIQHLITAMPCNKWQNLDIKLECFAEGGLRLMELMIGYDLAIIIDAITTHKYPLGYVTNLELDDLPNLSAEHSTSPHNTSLQNSLYLGKELGLHLPAKVHIIGVEAQNLYEFSEVLSPAIQAAIPIAANKTVQLLEKISKEHSN